MEPRGRLSLRPVRSPAAAGCPVCRAFLHPIAGPLEAGMDRVSSKGGTAVRGHLFRVRRGHIKSCSQSPVYHRQTVGLSAMRMYRLTRLHLPNTGTVTPGHVLILLVP